MRRRDLLVGAGALGALTLGGGAAPVPAAEPAVGSAARRPDPRRLPSRIAFGSCAKQDVPQPIWEPILEARPELFVFLGDNVYGDTRDPRVLREKYAMLAAQPGFRRLCERTPVLAIWDDHDYGENDAGGEYPMKEESRRIFCDFWGEPPDSARRTRDGIYDAVTLAAGGRTLQLLLPDLRFNRTPIRALDLGGKPYEEWAKSLEAAGREVPGPYKRNPDETATMLGERQWQWLEGELARPADVRILCSSLQVVADFPGWEAWINYAHDHQRLVDAIRRQRADGLVCISGDTHYAELSRLELNVPYTLWDLTSSGLTEAWHVTPPNARRVGEVLREPNFGWIEIDWSKPAPQLTLQARDAHGRVRIEQVLSTTQLRVA